MRGRVIGMATGICMALGMPAAAHAAATWQAVGVLSEAGAQEADAAMGSGGGAAVTWVQSIAGHEVVQVAARQPFGGFSPAVGLSPAAGEARAPQVAEDAAGDATVVWYASTGASFLVEAATVVDGIPSVPAQLSEAGQNAIFPTVAVNDRGAAIVAWARSNGANQIVQASFRPAGGSFGAPVNLSPKGQDAELPRVAIDAAGEATVVWSQSNGTPAVVEEATRSATGGFSKPVTLSDDTEGALYPFVAMNAAGDTAVTWIGSNGSGELAQVAVRPAGGEFDQAVSVSAEGANAAYPQVALDGLGDPTVVWTREFVVQYATGTPAGTFTGYQGLALLSWSASIAEDAAGDTLIGYADLQNNSAVAVFRPAGGAFGEPREISPAGQTVLSGAMNDEQGLNVAIDGEGDGVFGFAAGSGGEDLVQESQLDAVGIALQSVSIPATATVGVPVDFAATPVDRVAPTSVSWSFGDASTASGDSVTHTFANPGTYSVSATAAAAPGDSATQTGAIVVVARTAKAPPLLWPSTPRLSTPCP